MSSLPDPLDAKLRSWYRGRRVCVTGGAGFLGTRVCDQLRAVGVADVVVPRSSEFDLTQDDAVRRLFARHAFDVLIHLAAQVGGIGANQANPGRFFYANMAMGLHLIEHARICGIQKFVQIGSVCAYPKLCAIPFVESSLWDGYPEETNAPYGVAKRALATMIASYRRQYDFPGIYLIPVNLYGPGDNFDAQSSHVIPALIRKLVAAADDAAPSGMCWGTGAATREFLYVGDAAEAIVRATALYDSEEPMNLGSGHEIALRELAQRIADLCGYTGRLQWDHSRPDGQPRRQLDVQRAKSTIGWTARTPLVDGLRETVQWWKSANRKSPNVQPVTISPVALVGR